MTELADDREVIRAGYRAWNQGRAESFLHPDVEWITPPEVPGGGSFAGADATIGFLRNFEGTMGVLNLSFEIEEIIAAGDRYLVISTATGSGQSGVAVPAHSWFHLLTLEDRRLRRAELFLDRGQAYRAAGLAQTPP